ncbi:MAG: Inner membrane protein YqiK, partial [uncultured Solirubrobacteraceae bacterium]
EPCPHRRDRGAGRDRAARAGVQGALPGAGRRPGAHRHRRGREGDGRSRRSHLQDHHGRRCAGDPGPAEGAVPLDEGRQGDPRRRGRRLAEDPGRCAGRGDLQGRRRRALDHQRRHPVPPRSGRGGRDVVADARPRPRGLPRPPAVHHRRAVRRGPDREPQRARPADPRRLRRRDAEARPRGRLAADPGDRRPDGLHPRAGRAARRRGQEAGAHRAGGGRPRGDRARAGGGGAQGGGRARHGDQDGPVPGRARPGEREDGAGRPARGRRSAQAGRRQRDRGGRPRGPARGEAPRDDRPQAG